MTLLREVLLPPGAYLQLAYSPATTSCLLKARLTTSHATNPGTKPPAHVSWGMNQAQTIAGWDGDGSHRLLL